MWIRDRLDGLWSDEDFADWYPRDGRPGLSPAQLATVCVLQFLLGPVGPAGRRGGALPNRLQVRHGHGAGRSRLPPQRAGRLPRPARRRRPRRPAPGPRARPDPRAGLVRERTTQRTDSTHVLAAVRDLTRLELVTEAVRAALEEVAGTASRCWTSWSTRNGAAATAGRSACAPSPATPSPAWSRWATTPANCRNALTPGSPAARRCSGGRQPSARAERGLQFGLHSLCSRTSVHHRANRSAAGRDVGGSRRTPGRTFGGRSGSRRAPRRPRRAAGLRSRRTGRFCRRYTSSPEAGVGNAETAPQADSTPVRPGPAASTGTAGSARTPRPPPAR